MKVAPWKILHLQLREGIPMLPFDSDYQGLYVVVWWDSIPLGYREIPATQLPMPATQLQNLVLQSITPAVGDRLFEQGFNAPLPVVSQSPPLTPPLEALLACNSPLLHLCERWNARSATQTPVSVVVCTRNRPEQLAHCLQSLQQLTICPQEILVVDNAPSSDATRQCVAQIPGIRYVLEPRPGLSVARNTGIRSTTGNIIAFTDDDAMVDPNWITGLQQGFQDSQVMAVTGLVLPAELETEVQLLFEKGWHSFGQGYRCRTFGPQFFAQMKPRGVPVWRIGAGVNMAFRRQAFDQVGSFDERLGAGAAGCSEDSELWYRLLAQGWVCRYEPAAVVYHYHRRDLESLNQQAYQYMRGHVAALLIQFAKYKHWGNLRRLCMALPRHYAKLFLQGSQDFAQQYRTLGAELSGCLAGIKFYLDCRLTSLHRPAAELTTANPSGRIQHHPEAK
ncbi:MAG TPA: glycosyltransferase [Candidatus Caenarcaniphilales bacterium]